LINFLDIQPLLAGWFREQLKAHGSTAVVSSQIPPGHWQELEPKPLLQVMDTGGFLGSAVVDTPLVSFDTWGNSDAEARELAQLVRALMPTINVIGETQFYAVTEAGRPTEYPDSRAPSRARYRQIHSINYRAQR